ncbi:unnamed protein product [Pseudo-nitzschia multistriata]|uniref:Amino acid transporter transmembrane domain-containing protein n=1 Tax=Pseudo-nitzschia multistriata TaxID=183589 RepID=A0A448Z9F8_9STRA|nr:unnamed protein product [Pseudo-nitzschia multistriata]
MSSEGSPQSTKRTTPGIAKSPFFRPSCDFREEENGSRSFVRTAGGNTFRRSKNLAARDNSKKEHKSTILGCASNLVNAIVGAGIVGLPFAIQESGLVPGVVLVVLSALLTEKSLRLLIETAKHANVPSYETLAEAAYGKFGFWFVTMNMLVMAYGAMLTYLMIVKDIFSSILGVPRDDLMMRRAVLVFISSLVILPLSCQRDMADLAKTSKMNVIFDLLMVSIVVYLAFHHTDFGHDYKGINGHGDSISVNGYVQAIDSINAVSEGTATISLWQVRWDTIFVGLGVLSFAFVCQHSAFIIAGSLDNPTKQRWSRVTGSGLSFAACLALVMGVSGYLGFGDYAGGTVTGNILNSLPPHSKLGKIAKALLGTTMVFVYPMESFVARHACVVLLFEGRKAHEGDDTSVLNRRDRRITLTTVLYLIAVIPAALFEDLGDVLAVTGGVGGSCLSYIGPGIVYIGIHGDRFLELTESYFDRGFLGISEVQTGEWNDDEESSPLVNKATNRMALSSDDCFYCKLFKLLSWYLTGMPLWISLASIGKGCLTNHVKEMAQRSPHPIRIGNVRFARASLSGEKNVTRVVMLQNPTRRTDSSSMDFSLTSSSNNNGRTTGAQNTTKTKDSVHLPHDGITTRLLRADSLPTTDDGTNVDLPKFLPPAKSNNNTDYKSINQEIGAVALATAKKKKAGSIKEIENIAVEEDPQGEPPGTLDFAIAISYIIFGLIAMLAGLMSVFW